MNVLRGLKRRGEKNRPIAKNIRPDIYRAKTHVEVLISMDFTEVINSIQNGGSDGFEQLYNEYAKSTYFIALKIVGCKESAEEITQDVFLTVYNKISELKDPQAFPLWIKRITTNKCTDFLRKNNPFTSDIEEIAESEFIEETDPKLIPEKTLDNLATAQIIIEIIDKLPLPQRVCVYYYYYEHLTVKEIAEQLTVKETTVKNRLALARDKIRKELEQLEDDEGLKLYTAFPFILIPLLRRAAENTEVPQSLAAKILEGTVSTVTASTAGTATATEAATAGSVAITEAATAGTTATVSSATIKTGLSIKAIAAAIAGVAVTCCVILAVVLLNDDDIADADVTLSTAETIEINHTDPTRTTEAVTTAEVMVTESEDVTVTESEAVTTTESETVTATENEAITVTESEAAVATENEAVTATESEAVTETESETVTLTESDIVTATESEAVTETEIITASEDRPRPRVLRNTNYRADGSIDIYSIPEYDTNGNMIKRTNHYSDGRMFNYDLYENDSNGNIIRSTIYFPDGSMIAYAIYEYDSNGNLIKITNYIPNGNINYYVIYEYDSNGNAIKNTIYNSDGSILSYNVFEHDSNGNIIKVTINNTDNIMIGYVIYEYEI